jgi:hypothetical protein
MGAPFRRLRQHILRLPFLRFLGGCFGEITYWFGRRTVPDAQELADGNELTAEEIEAKKQERAEQFKRDQLLPILGIAGPPY